MAERIMRKSGPEGGSARQGPSNAYRALTPPEKEAQKQRLAHSSMLGSQCASTVLDIWRGEIAVDNRARRTAKKFLDKCSLHLQSLEATHPGDPGFAYVELMYQDEYDCPRSSLIRQVFELASNISGFDFLKNYASLPVIVGREIGVESRDRHQLRYLLEAALIILREAHENTFFRRFGAKAYCHPDIRVYDPSGNYLAQIDAVVTQSPEMPTLTTPNKFGTIELKTPFREPEVQKPDRRVGDQANHQNQVFRSLEQLVIAQLASGKEQPIFPVISYLCYLYGSGGSTKWIGIPLNRFTFASWYRDNTTRLEASQPDTRLGLGLINYALAVQLERLEQAEARKVLRSSRRDGSTSQPSLF